MSGRDFKPIDDAARDGKPKIVRRGPEYAKAYWHGGGYGGMWAYDVPAGGVVEQIDFEPTHYAELKKAAA